MTLLLKQREYQEKYSNDFYFYLITFYINPFFLKKKKNLAGVCSESDYSVHQDVCRTDQSEDVVRTIYHWSGMLIMLIIFCMIKIFMLFGKKVSVCFQSIILVRYLREFYLIILFSNPTKLTNLVVRKHFSLLSGKKKFIFRNTFIARTDKLLYIVDSTAIFLNT